MRKQSLQERYTALLGNYEEMSEHIQNLQEELDRAHKELYYLHEFIRYKKLGEEYSYFRKNAHEERSDDLPFPWLTL